MPDLMSHLLIGLILAEFFNARKKSLVVLGALMPDLLAKPFLIYLHLGIPQNLSFTAFHTPIMAFLLSVVISPLFKFDAVRTVLYLNIGLMSHFFSDSSIRHFSGLGVQFFYPFSIRGYSLGLIWPEQSVYVLIVCLAAYAVIKMAKKMDYTKFSKTFK